MATNFRNMQDGGFRLVPRSTDPSSPVEGDIFFSNGTPRAIGLWQYKSGAWAKLLTDASTILPLTTKTANYTATNADQIILCDASSGSFTITLPASSGNSGLTLYILKTDTSSNTVTIDGNSSETIDGTLTLKLARPFDSVGISTNGSNWFSIGKNTKKYAKYKTAAGQSVPAAATIIDFGTGEADPYALVTSGASWKFTADEPGLYQVEALVRFANATFTNTNEVELALFKNGSEVSSLGIVRIQVTQSNAFAVGGSTTIQLAATDYIDVRTRHSEGTNRSLSGDDKLNHISIIKIGN